MEVVKYGAPIVRIYNISTRLYVYRPGYMYIDTGIYMYIDPRIYIFYRNKDESLTRGPTYMYIDPPICISTCKIYIYAGRYTYNLVDIHMRGSVYIYAGRYTYRSDY